MVDLSRHGEAAAEDMDRTSLRQSTQSGRSGLETHFIAIVIDPETLGDKPNWRQIIDERIPSMMMLGVREASGMTRGDFVRLCFQDEPGRDEYPYAESFLEGFEKKHCYDRFWHGETGTRYMFSGYSMIMFGNGDPANPKDFFHATLGEHFRRHYFQMGLLIQLQFAALLSLSHRVSEAVKNKKNGDKTVFRDEMLDIEREFLAFEQRYWFSQVSNQLQAREIYDLWLERTNVAKVYLEVSRTGARRQHLSRRARAGGANQRHDTPVRYRNLRSHLWRSAGLFRHECADVGRFSCRLFRRAQGFVGASVHRRRGSFRQDKFCGGASGDLLWRIDAVLRAGTLATAALSGEGEKRRHRTVERRSGSCRHPQPEPMHRA